MKAIQFFSALFLAVVLVLPCSQALAMQKVFFVHSYDSKNVCGVPQQIGAVEMLKKLGFEDGENVKYKTFFMDTKKTYTSAKQQEARGKIALSMIKEFDPDVVVVMDDNAIKYVMLPLVDTKYQAVFSGMNVQIEDYDKIAEFMDTRETPGHNVTGVIEDMHFAESFKLMQKIVPGLKKVMFIADKTPTGNGLVKAIKVAMQKDPAFPVEVEIRKAGTFKEYKSLIHNANKRGDIQAIYPIAVGLEVAASKKCVVAPEIFAWTLKNSHKPDVAGTFFFCKFGILGGATVDFPSMGGEAGMKVARILSGEKAGDIPIENCKRFAIAINLARSKQLGIEIPYEILGAADHIYKVMALYPEFIKLRKGE